MLTEEIFEAGKSINGGWSNAQMRALGLETIPGTNQIRHPKGWKWRLIGSDVPEAKVKLFLSLKDKHLKNRPTLFDMEKIQTEKAGQCRLEEETNTIGSHKYNCGTCFHLKSKACKRLSSLAKVCQYWYDPNSKIQGLAYSPKTED